MNSASSLFEQAQSTQKERRKLVRNFKKKLEIDPTYASDLGISRSQALLQHNFEEYKDLE